MEAISLITICLGFGFIWFVTFIHPPSHRILRAKKTYNLFLYLSILSPIISIISFNSQMLQNRKETLFLSLYLLFFLLMYKCCNDYVLKKYNRNMYFKRKYNTVWNDIESDEAESIDEWFQYGLAILPLIFCYLIKYIILDVIIK